MDDSKAFLKSMQLFFFNLNLDLVGPAMHGVGDKLKKKKCHYVIVVAIALQNESKKLFKNKNPRTDSCED